MDDLISRQAAKLKVASVTWEYGDSCYDFHDKCVDCLDDVPSVERNKGKWIDYTEDGYVECPFCHSATNCDGNKDELHFCFSCGADMRGERDG